MNDPLAISITVWIVGAFCFVFVIYLIWCNIPTLEAMEKEQANGEEKQPRKRGKRRKKGVLAGIRSWIPFPFRHGGTIQHRFQALRKDARKGDMGSGKQLQERRQGE